MRSSENLRRCKWWPDSDTGECALHGAECCVLANEGEPTLICMQEIAADGAAESAS